MLMAAAAGTTVQKDSFKVLRTDEWWSCNAALHPLWGRPWDGETFILKYQTAHESSIHLQNEPGEVRLVLDGNTRQLKWFLGWAQSSVWCSVGSLRGTVYQCNYESCLQLEFSMLYLRAPPFDSSPVLILRPVFFSSGFSSSLERAICECASRCSGTLSIL